MTLFVYSKYSESSRFLMQYVANSHFIQKMCIDNPDVKTQILNSQIKISKVPCILVYHSVGTVEMFEGRKAFEWVNYNIYPFLTNSQSQSPVQPQTKQFSPISSVEESEEVQQSENSQQNQGTQNQQQHHQQGGHGTPIDMIPMISQDEKVNNNNNNDRGGAAKIDNSVKAKAEELERARNSLLFKDPPQIGGMKSGGPMNDVTNSIRQR